MYKITIEKEYEYEPDKVSWRTLYTQQLEELDVSGVVRHINQGDKVPFDIAYGRPEFPPRVPRVNMTGIGKDPNVMPCKKPETKVFEQEKGDQSDWMI